MRHALSTTILLAGLALVGCTRDDELKRDHKEMGDRMSTTQPMSGDACPMCEGKQTATADGTCAKCGMKM